MSLQYPQLVHTDFPNKVDSFPYFVDISYELEPFAKQYRELISQGRYAEAAQLLQQKPELKDCFINANRLNQLLDAVKASQLFYLDDVREYLMNLIRQRGDWNPSAKYNKHEIVRFFNNDTFEFYMCSKENTPIGTTPLDTTYWVALTLRGPKGEPGINLTSYGAWKTNTTYPKDAMVAHNNALWGSLIENVNIEPSEGAATTWYILLSFDASFLSFRDRQNLKRYELVIDNGQLYMEDKVNPTSKIEIARKIDIPTSLPANGGNADTVGGVAQTSFSRKSTTLNLTLASANWTGSAAPFTLVLSATGVTASNIVEVVPRGELTVEQMENMVKGLIIGTSQSSNSITLKAYGKKPSVDLPITVIVRGDL